MEERSDYLFKAEYAKSNRASCKGCKELISKDSLRLALMIQSPHFDGKVPNWFHFACFWKRGKPALSTDIHGFDSLRWEDQEKINAKLSGGKASGSDGGGRSKSAADDDDHKNFVAEYAKTGKSKCRGCEDFIPKGETRLAVKDYTSDRAMMYGPQNLWYHVDCFVKQRHEVGFLANMNPERMVGFESLAKEDRDDVINKLGKGEKATKGAKKRKAEAIGDAADVVDGKKPKVDDTETQQLKDQSKIMWTLRDNLQRDVSLIAMKGLLEYNNQAVVNSESELLDRLSDCMAFGALAACPECSQGQLVCSTAGYHCTGNLSGWTKCTFTTRTPKRVAFKVPPEYQDVAFLKAYKYVKRQRVFPQATLAASNVSSAPLRGLCFLIHGKTDKTKPTIKKMLSDLGADVASKLETNVHAVISTSDELKKGGKVIKGAEAMDIPVLAEGFLEACREGKLSEALTTYKLSSWGKEVTVADVVDSKPPRPTKSAAVKAAELRAEKAYLKESSGLQKLTVKGGAAVDPDSGLESKAHILQDRGIPLNAVLSMVDITSGCNSYYKLQVLEHDKSKKYWLFRSWGRIGTTIGGNKTEHLGSRESCIDKFKELFVEKTGNEWGSKEFVKHPNRFFPHDMDYGQESDELKLKAYAEGAGRTSKLPHAVQQLIKLIFDIETMKKTMLQFEIDMNKMPLGKLSKKSITAAYKLLQTCQQLVDEKASPAKILDASNQFFHLIPHDFGMKKPPLLDNLEIIKLKTEMLESLQEMEVAYSLLKSSDGEDMDPIDAHYNSLKTKIEPVSRESGEWEYITKYVENTHGKTHNMYKLETEEIFTVQRSGERSRYSPFTELPNRMLLWHGSRLSNYAGILSQGLRIAPPEAPVTGYMFGKGIYFADMVTKSGNYCHTTKSNTTGLLLLCEVALGNMHELGAANYVTKLPKGKHSVKGCGMSTPDPSTVHVTADGVVVPFGPGVDANPPMGKTSLLYNEYIVYDVAQVNIKYLVQCKFNYA